MENALKSLWEHLQSVWKRMRKFFSFIMNANKKYEEEFALRTTWMIEWDNRRCSQVIQRKPNQLIRKVI